MALTFQKHRLIYRGGEPWCSDRDNLRDATSGFEAAVQRYQAAHGDIPVVDGFDAVRPLTRRDTMLQVLADGLRLRVPPGNPDVNGITCLAPPQIVCSPGEPLDKRSQTLPRTVPPCGCCSAGKCISPDAS